MDAPYPTGARVTAWLNIRGWSVPELARKCGWNRQKAWRIAAGKVDLSATDATQIADALGVTMAEFYGGISASAAN